MKVLLRIFISIKCSKIKRTLHAVHGSPIEYQWIRNRTGVMVRKPPYSFKHLINVDKFRLNVYRTKR